MNRTLLGLAMGAAFGALLQYGGVTFFDVLVGQLLLVDFTVVRVMLSAVVVGMGGVFWLQRTGRAPLIRKDGSLGRTVGGGLLFGVGFGLLGYCPGTLMGAVGHGALDALCFGLPGMVLGSALYVRAEPWLDGRVLHYGRLGDRTLYEVLGLDPARTVLAASAIVVLLLGLVALL